MSPNALSADFQETARELSWHYFIVPSSRRAQPKLGLCWRGALLICLGCREPSDPDAEPNDFKRTSVTILRPAASGTV
jgi:hypothetical protein